MTKKKSKKTPIASYAGIALVCIALLFFLLRGPYLSNYIKRIIIPQLENVTRERIIIDKAVINLFPFYVQTKGFKIFDKEGNRLLWITKGRAYIDLLGLLSQELRVRKLTLKEPDLTASQEDINRVINNVKQSSSVGRKGKFKVILSSIEMADGNIKYSDDKGIEQVFGNELFLDMVDKGKTVTVDISIKNAGLKLKDREQLEGGLRGKAVIRDGRIDIAEINIQSGESTFKAEGDVNLSPEGRIQDGNFDVKSRIHAPILNSFFRVSDKKEGFVSFQGTVKMKNDKKSKWPKFSFDLETDSEFYLETLMDILNVNENITGKLKLMGKITGTYPDIHAKGTAELENARFDTLPIDQLKGNISYKNKKFVLDDFSAHLYDGSMKGNAHISIPHGDYFVDGNVNKINSVSFFRFIRWDPPFHKGIVNGKLQLTHRHKQRIQLIAEISYLNQDNNDGDILNRLENIMTSLELKNNILTISDGIMSTERSKLFMDGEIDFNKKLFDLNLEMLSNDVTDLTMPYYDNLISPVEFSGVVTGNLKDPEISGKAKLGSGRINQFYFESAVTDLNYKIKSLVFDNLVVQQNKTVSSTISGSIQFRKSDKIFTFKDPLFRAKASLKGIPVETLLGSINKQIPLSGRGDGTINFEGTIDKFKGDLKITFNDANVYKQNFDRINIEALFDSRRIHIKKFNALKNESVLSGSGKLFSDQMFDMNLSSDHLQLSDILALKNYPVDALTRLRLTGSGTIKKPEIVFSLNIVESNVNGYQAGKGTVYGNINEGKIIADGNLADGLITSNFSGSIKDTNSWLLNMHLHDGTYDFLAAGFLKEIADNFSIWGSGDINVRSDLDTLRIHSEFNSLNLVMYDYTFRNKGNIVVDVIDDILNIKSFDFSGKDANVLVSGNLHFDESYNISLQGDINVAPLKAFYDEHLKLEGRSKFDIDIKGDWDKPDIIGLVNIENVTAALTSYQQIIGPVNGTLFFNKNKITFDSVKADFSDGNIILSGAGGFDNLKLTRLNISSKLNQISLRSLEDIRADINGELYYEFSPQISRLSGNILVSDAKYNKNIDWKSTVLGLRKSDQASSAYPEFIKKTELNIQLNSSDNIWIDNNVAKAPLKLELNITGIVERVGLIGRMESNEGYVYFRGNEFRIQEGSSVDFFDSSRIQPLFHIIADTFITDYYIRLSLDGTFDQFTLSFFSDPPLPESDILTLLTFGHLSTGTKGIASGIAAGEATSILTGGIQENIKDELRDITGIERFEFQPHVSSTGSLTSKVTLGKRLLEDKISVIYSTTIDTTEEQVIKIEYKLNDELSLLGSRNEIGSAGADIKYQFQFK